MYDQITAYIRQQIIVTDEELAIILSCFKPLTIKKHELLLSHGQTSQRSFFVGQGCLRIYFLTEDGQDVTRYIAFENQWATALVSFITGQPSQEFIQAVENSELLYITHDDFYRLLTIVPSWEKLYRSYLEGAYVNNTNRLMSFITLDATERYRQLLEENPVVVQRLSNKMAASYLNVSQETLSRLKSKI
jgi:CRP-like cAMP-binding protein